MVCGYFDCTRARVHLKFVHGWHISFFALTKVIIRLQRLRRLIYFQSKYPGVNTAISHDFADGEREVSIFAYYYNCDRAKW